MIGFIDWIGAAGDQRHLAHLDERRSRKRLQHQQGMVANRVRKLALAYRRIVIKRLHLPVLRQNRGT